MGYINRHISYQWRNMVVDSLGALGKQALRDRAILSTKGVASIAGFQIVPAK